MIQRKNLWKVIGVIFIITSLCFFFWSDPVPIEYELIGWRSREKPILFVHLTKSAGTSVCRMAKHNGEAMLRQKDAVHFSCNLPFDGPAVNKFPDKSPPRFSTCQARARYLKSEMVSFNAVEHFLEDSSGKSLICDAEMRYFTILRNPMERIQSWIAYHKIPPEDVLRWLQGEDNPSRYSSPQRHYERTFLYPYVDNYLVRTLCGKSTFRLPPGAIDESHLLKAWTILQLFEKVIFFDELNQPSFSTFIAELGWPTETQLFHANPSEYQRQFLLFDSVIETLQNFNSFDHQLYTLAISFLK